MRKEGSHKVQSRNHIEGYNALDEMEDESDASSSGGDWDAADDDEVDEQIVDDEDEEDADMSDDEESVADEEDNVKPKNKSRGRPSSLVVSLRYQKKEIPSPVAKKHLSTSKEFTHQQQTATSIFNSKPDMSFTTVEPKAEPTVYNGSAGLVKATSTDPAQHPFPESQIEKPQDSIRKHYPRPAEDHLVEIS